MKFDTKVVHAGIAPDPTTGSIIPPIYETTTYVLDEVGKDKGFDYTRSANPTRQVLEANLAAIVPRLRNPYLGTGGRSISRNHERRSLPSLRPLFAIRHHSTVRLHPSRPGPRYRSAPR